MNKFLVGSFAIEVKNARLNGSSKDAEKSNTSLENISYTKKISSGRNTFPYMSTQKTKYCIKQNCNIPISIIKQNSTTEALSEGNPYKNYDEDVMGFMIAQNSEIDQEEFNTLSELEQKGYTKSGKGKNIKYKKNITKKRRSRLMMSPLQAIGHTKIHTEFCTKMTDIANLIYSKEVYSAIMSSGFCLDVNNVGVFSVSEDASGFRDYAQQEVEGLNYAIKDGKFELSYEEKKKRIVATIKGIEYLHTFSCQNNNYEDINAKFIILCEYSIGNAVFNNIFRNNELDIEYLIEAIKENKQFRLSNIYIGVRTGFMENLKNDLENEIARNNMNEYVKIGSVGEIIDSYIVDRL